VAINIGKSLLDKNDDVAHRMSDLETLFDQQTRELHKAKQQRHHVAHQRHELQQELDDIVAREQQLKLQFQT
jgi:uncharacterized protein (DUF3084 family)